MMKETPHVPDRRTPPLPGDIPVFSFLHTKDFERTTLDNGLHIVLYRYKKLPVVQINLVVHSGADADPVSKPGAMQLLAEMIDEGTDTRTSLQVSEAFDYIGANFSTWVTLDGMGTNLLTLKEFLRESLDIFSDLIINPALPESEFERIKQNAFTSILQEADQPNVIASKVFRRMVFGENHPYGQPVKGTADSVRNMTVVDVRKLYSEYVKPNNSTIIVVGDMSLEEVTELVGANFADWKKGNARKVEIPSPSHHLSSRIYLVDRPGAVQSQLRIGHVGIERAHSDHFPVTVMNQILGGQFTSRINLNLREEKGYTYGAGAGWESYRNSGCFSVGGAFQGEFTDRSVAEIVKEIDGVRREGVTEDELRSAKDGLILSLPRHIETPSQIARYLGTIALYGLSDNYYETYVEKIKSVERVNAHDAAKNHLYPDKCVIVAVGDRKSIKEPLQDLGIGDVVEVKDNGEAEKEL